jgi:hypothetical protein
MAFQRNLKDTGITLQTFRNPDELARLVERSLAELKQRERARQVELAQRQQPAVPQEAARPVTGCFGVFPS